MSVSKAESKKSPHEKASERYRLLYDPCADIEIHEVELCDGCIDLTACLTEEEMSLLASLILLPLQCDYSPFPTTLVKQVYIKLLGSWGDGL